MRVYRTSSLGGSGSGGRGFCILVLIPIAAYIFYIKQLLDEKRPEIIQFILQHIGQLLEGIRCSSLQGRLEGGRGNISCHMKEMESFASYQALSQITTPGPHVYISCTLVQIHCVAVQYQ